MRHFVLAPSTGQDSHVLCKHRKSYVFFCDCHSFKKKCWRDNSRWLHWRTHRRSRCENLSTKRRCSECSYSEWHLLYFLCHLWKVVEEHMKSEAEEKQILEKRRNDIQLVSSEVEMQAGRELAEARRKWATLYYPAHSTSTICMDSFGMEEIYMASILVMSHTKSLCW